MALCPPPVSGETTLSLFAVDSPETITLAISQPDLKSWKSIYIHHSKTNDGSDRALAKAGLGDHFVISNGSNGDADGELKIRSRWRKQTPAIAPRGATSVHRECISICLVGDFDAAKPTAAQLRRLSQLVASLQSRHGIAQSSIFTVSQLGTPASIGRNFPLNDFRDQVAAGRW